jgi:pyruvate dehydrogenase (quinone)
MVLGYPEYGVRHSEPFADYAAFATANGALGAKVSSPGSQVGSQDVAWATVSHSEFAAM